MKGTILGVLLILSIPALSQTAKPKNMMMADFNRFHFGYSVGINTTGFISIAKDGYDLDLVQNPGININLITDYRLGKFLAIRFLPGIQFAQRDFTIINKLTAARKTWKIESVYVDLPVILKYRSQRVNNYAPYLLVGISPRFDLTRAELIGWKPATPMLKSFDIYPEIGAGVDFYLSMAKVAVELKFSVGLLNIFLGPDITVNPDFNLYVAGVEKIYSRMVILAFHVEQSR